MTKARGAVDWGGAESTWSDEEVPRASRARTIAAARVRVAESDGPKGVGEWRLRCLRFSTRHARYPIDVRVSPDGTATAHYDDAGTATFQDLAHLFLHHSLDLEDFREVPEESPPFTPRATAAAATILIVDGDGAIRQAMSDLLESTDAYRVFTAYDVDCARRLIGRCGPDMVIVDLPPCRDPELDWVAELVSEFSGAVLAMSTDPRDEIVAACLGLPFLVKPFNVDELLAKLSGRHRGRATPVPHLSAGGRDGAPRRYVLRGETIDRCRSDGASIELRAFDIEPDGSVNARYASGATFRYLSIDELLRSHGLLLRDCEPRKRERR